MALGALAMVLALLSLESLEGLTVDTGALLLAGGLVALGLSALTTAVETLRALVAGEELPLAELEQAGGGLAPSFGESMSAAAANSPASRPKPQERQGRQEPDMAHEVMPMSKARRRMARCVSSGRSSPKFCQRPRLSGGSFSPLRPVAR